MIRTWLAGLLVALVVSTAPLFALAQGLGAALPGLNKACSAALQRNDAQAALRDCELASKLAAEMGSANPPAQALAFSNMGDLRLAVGEAPQAELLYRSALALKEKHFGAASREMADTYNALGMVAMAQTKPLEAEQFFSKAFTIRQIVLPPSDPLIGRALANAAVAVQTARTAQEAEPMYRQALELQERALGPQHLSLTDTIESLARANATIGKPQEAEIFWRRSLALRERNQGAEHPDTATVINELGMLYTTAGADKAAEEMFRKALAMRTKAFGRNDLQVAEVANNLGVLLYTQGRLTEALPQMQQAASVTYVALGPDANLTRARWNNLQRAMVAASAAQR